MPEELLVVRGAREHNLKNIDIAIPRDRLTVITGLSGSGKSSLAFDTIYAEGQRRYVESLSAYARQFFGLMEKPDVDAIEGLSPAISIEQKSAGHNPRSTVGTVTEIYDYLRLLYARVGTPHCPKCGRAVERQSATQIADTILSWPASSRIEVLAPLVRGRKGEFRDLLESARKQGFVRAMIDGKAAELADPPKLAKTVQPQHFGHRRPPRGARGGSQPPNGLAGDGAQAGRRPGRGRAPWRRDVLHGAGVLGALRLSGVRPLAGRARAAAVLVQFAVRRLLRVRWVRHAAGSERGADSGRRAHLDSRGRDSPVGRAVGPPAQVDSARARQAIQVRSQCAVGRSAAPRSAK